jgi:hypothetical protein
MLGAVAGLRAERIERRVGLPQPISSKIDLAEGPGLVAVWVANRGEGAVALVIDGAHFHRHCVEAVEVGCSVMVPFALPGVVSSASKVRLER